ncbi:MAG: Mrp/NBP35 family ATP-binding protein [Candidatus Neomarinimicrobiota bacterium]|nr:Mrp/NBP35 family ATP-binding protein [Candidatus Neomarinimicrobiota bacterium]
MDKDKVKELLSKINYPGFNRDIISFGMVNDIQIETENVIIYLKITSQNEEKKKLLVKNIKENLGNHFSSVSVEIDDKGNNNPSSASSSAQLTTPILPEVKHIIAIASGKGGVGKSTVASNIACGLKHKGFSVGLLDLDIYGPSLPIILGINQQPEMTKDNRLIPLDRYGMKVMSFGFISGNDTPVIWRGPLVSRMTEQFFKDVDWGQLDYLILDLPPGTGDVQLTLTQKLRISGAIIVTTPQDIALSDVRKGADMFEKVKTPILGVIENMSGFMIDGVIKSSNGEILSHGEINLSDGSVIQISEIGNFEIKIDLFKKGGGETESKRLNIPLLGQIPISNDIVISTDNGTPIVHKTPDHKTSNIYYSIIDQILTILN